jgi:hypothetical protein
MFFLSIIIIREQIDELKVYKETTHLIASDYFNGCF